MTVWGCRRVGWVLLCVVLAGCGSGDPGADGASRTAQGAGRGAGSADSTDNRTLAVPDLAAATVDALYAESSYRATVVLGSGAARERFAVEVSGSSRYRGLGALEGFRAILNSSGTTYFRPGRLVGYPPEAQAAVQAAVRARLGGRWIVSARGVEVVDRLRTIDRMLRYTLVNGGAESGGGTPVRGEAQAIDGRETVAYRYPSGVEVHVPRHGSPLPVRIDAPSMSVSYRDYGEDISVVIPPLQETVAMVQLLAEVD